MNGIILYMTLILWIFIKTVFNQYLQEPQNAYAFLGQRLKITCTIENAKIGLNKQLWKRHVNNTEYVISEDESVVSELQGKYAIEGSFNLIIKSVVLEDVGNYSCLNFLHKEKAFYVYIVILSSNPIITSDLKVFDVDEGQDVSYTCQISVSGAWKPVMSFKSSNPNISITATDSSVSNSIKLTLSFKAATMHDGLYFTCITRFQEPPWPREQYKATNIISYVHTETTDVLNVIVTKYQTTAQDIYDEEGDGSLSAGLLALAIVLPLIVIAAVIIVVLIVVWRYRRGKNEEDPSGTGDKKPEQSPGTDVVTPEATEKSNPLTVKIKQKRGDYENEFEVTGRPKEIKELLGSGYTKLLFHQKSITESKI